MPSMTMATWRCIGLLARTRACPATPSRVALASRCCAASGTRTLSTGRRSACARPSTPSRATWWAVSRPSTMSGTTCEGRFIGQSGLHRALARLATCTAPHHGGRAMCPAPFRAQQGVAAVPLASAQRTSRAANQAPQSIPPTNPYARSMSGVCARGVRAQLQGARRAARALALACEGAELEDCVGRLLSSHARLVRE
jgi:hypothetical protein